MNEIVCIINGKDSRQTWGVTFGDGSLSELQKPAPMKKNVENSSRLTNGKQVIRSNKVDTRDVSLIFWLSAPDIETYQKRYNSFIEELHKDTIVLETKFEPGKKYRLNYDSCNNYKVYNGTLGKFTLKLNEPDPTNRS